MNETGDSGRGPRATSQADPQVPERALPLSSVAWPWLKPPLSLMPAQQRIGQQWADTAAMALHQAMVPRPSPRRVERAYMDALIPAVWGKRDLESHGVKAMVEG